MWFCRRLNHSSIWIPEGLAEKKKSFIINMILNLFINICHDVAVSHGINLLKVTNLFLHGYTATLQVNLLLAEAGRTLYLCFLFLIFYFSTFLLLVDSLVLTQEKMIKYTKQTNSGKQCFTSCKFWIFKHTHLAIKLY